MATPAVVKDVLSSRKFIYVTFLFMLPITIFTAIGLMTIQDWRHDALWALGFLVSGHTLEGMAASIAAPRPPSSDQSTTAAAVTVNVPIPQETRPMNADELRAMGVKVPPEPPPPIRSGDS